MKIKYIVLFVLLALVGCQRDEEMEITQLTISNEQIKPSYSSVAISCSIISNVTIKSAMVYVSESQDFSGAHSYLLAKKNNTFTAEIDGLADGTTYYVRYKISNRWSSLIAEETSTFQTTPTTIPTISTAQPSEVTYNSAIIGGTIISNGGQDITSRGVVYSTSPNPTIENSNKVENKDKLEAFACSLTNLEVVTTYYARAYAANKKGVAYGEEVSFTTSSTNATMGEISAIEIGGTTAIIQAELLADGGADITQLGICYNVKGEPTTNDSIVVSSENKIGIFQCTIANLFGGRTYYVRAFATNANGTVYSEQISFCTEATIATVLTTQPTEIAYTSATVGGNVTDDGGASVTECGICYSTSANPTISDTKIQCESGIGSFNCNLTGLQDSTTYYARAYAINAKGTSYGEVVSFTTQTQKIASVVISKLTNIYYTSVTISGNITNDGGAVVTEYGICYSTNTNPTTTDIKISSSSGSSSFICNLTNLQDATTYYVRAYAINAKGIAYSEEISFTTKERVVADIVDLGLSVKWATFNIGASKPEEYGDYFAWGETYPTSDANWTNYKYSTGDYPSLTLTKYNTVDSYGIVDNKTILEPEDDAACVHWGDNWRMPTYAELYELIYECTWECTSQNGVNGYKVISKSNGKSIFLPAAGLYNPSPYEVGSDIHYWSSTLNTVTPIYAEGITFVSDSFLVVSYHNRNCGMPIRPVYGQRTVEDATLPSVVTQTVTQITATTAVVEGKVITFGASGVTERGVVYSMNPNPTTTDTKISSASGTGSYTCYLTGLQPNTTYYVRAYAINASGTAYGEVVSFTTEDTTTPEITIEQPTQYSVDYVTFECKVNHDGGTEITNRGVCYGTSPTPTISNDTIEKGSGLGNFNCSVSNLEESTTYYVRAFATNSKGTAYSNEISFTTRSKTYIDGYEYADLGLSIKWATHNIGSTQAEDYGDYFAWGETETKKEYNWSTYKWGGETSLKKYNTINTYGVVDNRTILELSDDAAYTNWGGNWRMPTVTEFQELLDNCIWRKIIQNGVVGYRLISRINGNSIFFPAAGLMDGDELKAESYGYYRSSSLCPSFPVGSEAANFLGSIYISSDYRMQGKPIRPVHGLPTD